MNYTPLKYITFISNRFLLTIILLLIMVTLYANNYFKINRFIYKAYSSSSNVTEEAAEDDYEAEDWSLNGINVPPVTIILGNDTTKLKMENKSCAMYPSINRIHFSNIFWQVQNTDNENYYLYGAYLDMREPPLERGGRYDAFIVRILGMSNVAKLDEGNSTLKVCQYWFENWPQPEFGAVIDITMVWKYGAHKERYFPYLISCQFPPGLVVAPVSVSVVPTRCSHATNNLLIHHTNRVHETSSKTGFAVCVKGLDYPSEEMRFRLMEWIETIRQFDVEKIYMYEYFVHPEIKQILNYYESKGVVDVMKTSLPAELPNQAQLRHLFLRLNIYDKRMVEVVVYNDCFYRNMYDYKYIALLDTDEIIISTDNGTWSDLVYDIIDIDIGQEQYEKNPPTTFCFQNYLHLDEMLKRNEEEVKSIPDQFYMLRHVFRSPRTLKRAAMKCFHSTKESLGLHNHVAFFCRGEKQCVRYDVDPARGQLNHYRFECSKFSLNCTDFVTKYEKDTILWRHKDAIINNVIFVAKELDMSHHSAQ